MTDKLYYTDSHISRFTAQVVECLQTEKGYAIRLDKTAFFPEGGGQAPDTGYIGEARVLDVQEKGGKILHYTEKALVPGAYDCVLDYEQRLRRMQNHSGEHIVSGIVNSTFGFDNVGFHMSTGFMTIDFSGELSWDQLMDIEKRANEAVRENIPILQHFPTPGELEKLRYRSKLELTENVRLVEIPGVDICACCAPHVLHTGEIGIIKIFSSERHRGGIRVTLSCGMDALDIIRNMQENVTAISNLLSAKRDETSAAVERLMAERDDLKFRLAEMENILVSLKVESILETDGNICLFVDFQNEAARIELANLLMPKCGGVTAIFCGSDDEGWKYIIGSRNINLRENSKRINAAIDGRGGGKPEMIMGRASKARADIEAYFSNAENLCCQQ